MSSQKRKVIPPVVRFQVFSRDGFKCIYCGADRDRARLVVDHVIPVRDGGTDDIGNLATACHECNAGKAARGVVSPEPGEFVGRERARLGAKWESHLQEVFRDLRAADTPAEGGLLYDPTEVGEFSDVVHMPNFTARAPRHGGWRGEELTISVFAYHEDGQYPADVGLDIRNAVICGYFKDAVIILGAPDRFFAVCVNYRYKGNPLGYSLGGDMAPMADWWCPGWYPDENGDFQDIVSQGDLYPLGTFNREGKVYGV